MPQAVSQIENGTEAVEHKRAGSVIPFLAFLGILLAFGIDVALPAFDEIRSGFQLDSSGNSVSLVVTVYFIGLAFGQLIYGPFSDRFGRIPALQVGLTLYAIGALAAALAPSFGFLLAARLVWGLGAAGPGALRVAIARDLFDGDDMARIVTIVTAVFMIGPIFVPVVGEGLLLLGPWQIVFYAGLVLAVIASGWAARFGESLPVERRRTLAFRPIYDTARVVFSNRTTMGYIAAQTFSGAAFFVYLGSSQPIIDRIYGRADQFAFIFGGLGLVMVLFLLVNDRLIRRFGTFTMVRIAGRAVLILSLVGLALSLTTDGVPPIGWWLVWAALCNALIITLSPMCSALALAPMGDKAGMASAILGAITVAGGALLAAVVDSQIVDTVTPMAVGYVVYSLLMVGSIRWANTGADLTVT